MLKHLLLFYFAVCLAACSMVTQSGKVDAGQSLAQHDSAGQQSTQVYRVRLFFGLSLPGGGGVSLAQWQDFQNEHIAKEFEGFNVVDSTGYYKGKPERSKIVTIIVKETAMPKVKALAAEYARLFHQDSVMLVKVPVLAWEFIGPNDA